MAYTRALLADWRYAWLQEGFEVQTVRLWSIYFPYASLSLKRSCQDTMGSSTLTHHPNLAGSSALAVALLWGLAQPWLSGDHHVPAPPVSPPKPALQARGCVGRPRAPPGSTPSLLILHPGIPAAAPSQPRTASRAPSL